MRIQRKDMTKRVFTWMLVFGMIVGMLPVPALAAEFAAEYTVSAQDYNPEGGAVRLNNFQKSVTAGQNEKVSLSVSAKENYRIQEVRINGEVQTITDAGKESFEKDITITKNVILEASFVQVYTVSVKYDSQHGTVSMTPEGKAGDGGSVTTVQNKKEFCIMAKPKENYRVSRVVKNNLKSEYQDNNCGYIDMVDSVDRDYNYEITFAPNCCQVQVIVEGTEGMGKVSYPGNTGNGMFFADWDKTAQITMSQNEGYHVSSVKVNGAEKLITDAVKEAEGEEKQLILSLTEGEVKQTTAKVQVTFAEDEKIDHTENPLVGDDYEITFVNRADESQTVNSIRDYTDDKGNRVYILPKDTKIKVTPQNPYTYVQVNDAGSRKKALNFEETQEIFSITVSKGLLGLITPKHINVKIRLVVDKTQVEVACVPEPANENGIYNHDVKVQINASETQKGGQTGDYSGIKEVICEVRKDRQVTQKYTWKAGESKIWKKDEKERKEKWENWIPCEGEKPKQSEFMSDFSEEITVDAEKNNSSKTTVYVKVTDYAGNESTRTLELDIDTTPPEIEVSYQGNYAVNGKYFPAMRKATVKIRERSNHFDAQDAKKGITITARDAKGNLVKDIHPKAMLKWDTHKSNRGDDWDTHEATIIYNRDANYTFSIAYTDKAGNKAGEVNTGDSVAPYEFTVDQTPPTGTVKAEAGEKKEKKKETWSDLIDDLTVGFWAKGAITVTGTERDETSPIARVDYIQTDEGRAIEEASLRGISEDEWKPFDKVTIQPNQRAVIYVRIKDMAGNTAYISSGGMIADNRKPKVESLAPKITIEPEKQPVNGIYKKNVKVNIKVQDPEAGGTYSGLKEIKYRVLNKDLPKKDQITQSGVLYSFEELLPSQKDLKKSWSGSITVDSAKNNSNHVVIQVYAEDNAGNIRGFGSQESKREIKIDTTAPRIDVSYNNNSPDSGKYYRNDRVATITVTERNFDPDQVKAAIRNTSGAVPALSNWTTIAGSKDGNGDDTRHTATLTYHADGDYTFGIRCTDLAGHECPEERVGYGNSANPKEFTIDQTAPVVTVSYDNNDAQNGKYFKEKRTATVTITERNFDESRVQFTQTASLGGSAMTAPAASWSGSGDVHTATFSYEEDGDYTFDVTMSDMAGNESGGASYGDSVAGQEFTVDTKIEKPVIEGVENGKSYKGDVVPSISYGDVNLAGDEEKLLRTRKDEKNVDVTEEFIKNLNRNGRGGSGINDTFEKKPENDGIYTLTVKVSDLAGNEEVTEVTFTVNRFGSVYVFDDYLISLKDAYTQEVQSKLVITEYNPDKLVKDSLKIQITRDGTPLENLKYTVRQVVNDQLEEGKQIVVDGVRTGKSGWYQYEYAIDMENFAEDGIYQLAVASEDMAGNKPETANFEECDVLFRVDTTPPEIQNVTGLEHAIVNAESQNVNFDVFDAIGLKKVTVYVDEKEAGSYDSFEDLVHFSGSAVISEGADQKVRFVIEDLAGNVTDTSEKSEDGQFVFQPEFDFIHSLTVSTNAFVRWYANKMLFWGTIGGVLAAGGLFILLLVWKRRKKFCETV